MEQARLWLGLIVALTLPLDLPVLRRTWVISVAFTLAYSAYATFPVLSPWWSAIICVTAVFASTTAVVTMRRRSTAVPEKQSPVQDPGLVYHSERPFDWRKIARNVRNASSGGSVAVVATIGLALVLALATGAFYGAGVIHHLRHLWRNNNVALVLSGLLVAMFVVNHLVYLTVRPLLEKLQGSGEDVLQLLPTSEYIGWIERALVFSFVVGGQPAAAALAIAVKSLARLPDVSAHSKGFTEYFLVGTMASLLAAVAVAIFVRIALGLAPL